MDRIVKREHDRKYREKHRKELNEKQRAYYKKHQKEIAKYNKQWRNKNAEKQKKYRMKNQDKITKQQKEYIKTVTGCLHRKFCSIKQRCEDQKHPSYKNYGGRGIECRFGSSQEFIGYVINILKVNPCGLQIDRIDNNRHYEKGNIRFVTAKTNSNNKRNNVL